MTDRTCIAPACEKRLHKSNKSGLCRSHRMRALHADPEFAKASSERASEWMRALQADPEFNPLAALTAAERGDYDVLRKAKYSRREALLLLGRDDLVVA